MKKQSFPQMVLGQWDIHMQKDKTLKCSSKWIIDLNVQAKTINLLEENIGINIRDLGLGKALLDMTTKAHVTEGDPHSPHCPQWK